MAEEEAEESSSAEGAEAAVVESGGGGGASKLVLILTALNLAISSGVIALVWLNFKKQQTPPGIEDIQVHGAESKEAKSEGKAEGKGEGKAEGKGEGKAEGGGEPIPTQEFGKMVALDQFTVNLINSGSVSPKYIRVNLSVEIPSDDTEEEISQKMPRVRNSIIDLLNSKRPQDLSSRQGRDYLKEEIRNTLNSFLVTGKVKGVYITSIAVTS